MISSQKNHFISVLIIVSLSLSPICVTRASRFENAESISDQKYTQTAYICFDKQMLNFLNSFKARLESVSNEITPQEERVFDLVMIMVAHKKREMEQYMNRQSWFLRSGRWKKKV